MVPPQPPNIASGLVSRDRLLPILRTRFERRVTVVQAGAGFGKSTLLRQAVTENGIEHLGVDAWVRLSERDRRGEHLCRRIGEALDAPAPLARPDDIVELVWSRAPTSVALIVDDAHLLGDEAAGWEVVEHLLAHLPRNGHLVVSGRQAPRLPLARWRASGEAVVLDEADLRFDAEELGRFGALYDLAPDLVDDLPPWPALATLTGMLGHRASMAFLWEEVLDALDERQRRLLGAVAGLGPIDDQLVAALGDAQVRTAAQLVAGLPLAELDDDGIARLHDLWTNALASNEHPDTRALRRAAGDHLAERGDLARAAEAYDLAGADDAFTGLAMRVARRPAMWADVAEIGRILELAPTALRDRPLARYLEAARAWSSDERLALALFRATVDEAIATGDQELEMLALWRIIQFEDLDIPGGPVASPALDALAAAGVPLARSVLAFVRSRRAQTAGDPDASVRELGDLYEFDEDQRANAHAIRMIDLGRPEAVPASLEAVLGSGLGNIYHAQALWLQGVIDPTLAWPIARTIVDRLEGASVTLRASALSVLTCIALAAGDEAPATAMAEQARREAPLGPRTLELFADVAEVQVRLATEGEAAAVSRLTDLVDRVPLGHWPERPYLYVLCLLRALVPAGEALDRCAFGPAVRTGVEAGAALAALRRGDPGPAALLPWAHPDLLRVHVPAPLLVELALAVDHPQAKAVLQAVPHQRRWLSRLADRPALTTSGLAATRLDAMPARPPFQLTIRVLGEFDIERSDGRSTDGWDRRERVRQLLAYLVLHRSAPRTDVAAALWPELSSEKATSNLRVNLAHLQAVLQPERTAPQRPWFVDGTASRLALVREGVEIDLDQHDAAVAAAVAAEASGLPSQALEHYRRAIDLYGGPVLAGLDVDWVELERIRLQSSAYGAVVRVGELLLACGEPEQAMHLAVRAQRLDPLSERSHRLFVRCHLAIGSTTAAREAARRLLADLADVGIAPDRETRLLLRGLHL